jgi:Cu-processing system ATP-binding protein
MSVEIERLTKRFGRTTACEGISCTVKAGEVFAFLGPNGSGKTSTMKCIVGLNIPTSGRVLVNGLDVATYPTETRHFVSYLPQRVVFPENLSAREILRFYCRLRRLPSSKADETIERARFAASADKPVGEFSGGMVQQLGLAVIALPDSPILVLDEPTASLDPQGVKRFREFVLHQKENGKTIIFSTHLLQEAELLADRVGVFVGGKLVAQESIESIRRMSRATVTLEDMYLQYVGAVDHE